MDVDRLYAEYGSEANEKSARAAVDITLPILLDFDLIAEDEHGRISLKQ